MQGYQKLASKSINGDVVTLQTRDIQASNFSLGLADDFFETLVEVMNNSPIVKLEDEFGDIRWYSAALATIYQFEETSFDVEQLDLTPYLKSKTPVIALMLDYGVHIGKVQAFVKKTVYHKKDKPLEELQQLLTKLQAFFLAACLLLDLSPDRIEEGNIKKLAKRHEANNGYFSFKTANSYAERKGV